LNLEIRKESEIFSELAELCVSPGYVHAIAHFCFRDNTIKYSDTITSDNILTQYSKDKLVRTEISTLIGLLCKKPLSTELPSPDILQKYIVRTDSLLKEIHESMVPLKELFDPCKIGDQNFNPFKKGNVLREAIFYGGESAYQFQYRDLSKIKNKKDNDWLLENKGFSAQQAFDIVTSIQLLQNKKINYNLNQFANQHPNEWNFLESFKFTTEEVSGSSNINIDVSRQIIESFVAPMDMHGFNSLDDFNPKKAYPIIKLQEDTFLLFQNYNLVEALYETPFFWFCADKQYQPSAMQHRGEFTEEFSAERLKLVFGEHRVYMNIDIFDSKGDQVGEIDVLVVFGNRVILLQAKSKKLTIAARKGNDNCLKEDFKKAVQEAYDQAFSCASFLTDKNYKLIDKKGNELNIKREYKEIYPFCVVSDHYPALSFQAMQFLVYQETKYIKVPFVMDVFFLDVITEMLQSPLHFLSYINRRTSYGKKIISSHELTILSYHLKNNLYMDEGQNMMILGGDLCADLDLAMMVRREGLHGSHVPEGILTKYKDTEFDQIIKDINILDHPATIDLGFMLLALSGNAIETINDGISQMIKLKDKDGKPHDFTFLLDDGATGLTLHLNDDDVSIAVPRLENHCKRRKYIQKASSWFGICIGQASPRLRFGVNNEYDWVQSNEMDHLVKNLPKPQKVKRGEKFNFKTVTSKSKKVGRNDDCPCGSGKKFKKCCLS